MTVSDVADQLSAVALVPHPRKAEPTTDVETLGARR